MAAGNMNQCNFIGRLVDAPTQNNFAGGGYVASFRLAFTGKSKKNPQTGKYEDIPCFVDVKAFCSADGKGLGSVVMQYTQKGTQVRVTGRLVQETWQDKNGGGNRSKHVIEADELTLLAQPGDGAHRQQNQGGGQNTGQRNHGGGNYQGNPGGGQNADQGYGAPPGGGYDSSAIPPEDIPF